MESNQITNPDSYPEKIVWSHEFSVGKEFIDDDHKTLFNIYNQLVEYLGDAPYKEGFAELLSKMTDYSLSHFSKEEEYMMSIKYPNFKAHREQHKSYIKKTALYNSRFMSADPPVLKDVVLFLQDWWKEHILFNDMKYELYRRNLILNEIRESIKSVSSDEGRIGGERFFKEIVSIYGAKSADISAISRESYNRLEDKDKTAVFALCEDLFKSGFLEESFIACDWAFRTRKYFDKNDFDLFRYWINNYITNWATCDTFCNHTMGDFIDKWPEYITELKRWTSSSNRWVRRAAAVSLIVPAREGRYKEDIFEIADLLLKDSDDMVQKGYGWMLKSCSKPYPMEVFRFVTERKKIMPRTSLRYAIEKLPDEMKKEAMQK